MSLNLFGPSQPPYPGDGVHDAVATRDGSPSEHLTLKAVTERITDKGLFTALVSVNTPDRERDTVERGAFAATIERWKQSGKQMPLAIDHSTAPEDVVGTIDPAEMEETDAGLVVGGKVDLESPRGPAAWKAIKSGAFGFSIGFLIQDSRSRGEGKGRVLTALDLFEISLTATPMVFESRVLTTKSMDEEQDDLGFMTDAELKAYSMEAVGKVDRKAAQPITVRTFEC